jgi:hypothetical protein
MAKRKTERKRELAKSAEAAPPMDYKALVTAIEQATKQHSVRRCRRSTSR